MLPNHVVQPTLHLIPHQDLNEWLVLHYTMFFPSFHVHFYSSVGCTAQYSPKCTVPLHNRAHGYWGKSCSKVFRWGSHHQPDGNTLFTRQKAPGEENRTDYSIRYGTLTPKSTQLELTKLEQRNTTSKSGGNTVKTQRSKKGKYTPFLFLRQSAPAQAWHAVVRLEWTVPIVRTEKAGSFGRRWGGFEGGMKKPGEVSELSVLLGKLVQRRGKGKHFPQSNSKDRSRALLLSSCLERPSNAKASLSWSTLRRIEARTENLKCENLECVSVLVLSMILFSERSSESCDRTVAAGKPD